MDFNATLVAERIDLSGVAGLADIAQITGPGGAASTVGSTVGSTGGSSVLIDTGGGNSILLEGVSIGDLDDNDFIFG